MDMRISPLRIELMLESNPLESRILVRRLAVRMRAPMRRDSDASVNVRARVHRCSAGLRRATRSDAATLRYAWWRRVASRRIGSDQIGSDRVIIDSFKGSRGFMVDKL